MCKGSLVLSSIAGGYSGSNYDKKKNIKKGNDAHFKNIECRTVNNALFYNLTINIKMRSIKLKYFEILQFEM